MPRRRITDVRRVATVEGEDSPVVGYEGTLTLSKADDDPVTLADLPDMLADAMTESSIPGTAVVTQDITIVIQY